MTLTKSWRHNPVAKAELKHQKYVIDTNHAARIWIFLALLMVIPAMLVSLSYYGAAFLLPFDPSLWDRLQANDSALVLVMVVNLALYIVVTLMTLALSSDSIRREKNAQTWEHLLITTIDPGLIVLGKWWASTRMLVGDHVMVVVLRLGIVGWMGSWLHEQAPADIAGLPAVVVLLPVLGLITFIYAALDMAFTAALGVLAGLLSQGGGLTATAIFVIRGVVALAALWVWVLTATIIIVGENTLHWLAVTEIAWASYGLLTWAVLAVARVIVINHARLGG